MKRAIATFLAILALLSFSACSSKQSSKELPNQNESGASEDKSSANSGSKEETGGQKVTFGILDVKDVSALNLATDKCFVYTEDSFASNYGIADYEGNILAKAKYTNFEYVENKLILWRSDELVVYNTEGERLYCVSPAEGDKTFSQNMSAHATYYYTERVITLPESASSNNPYITTVFTYDGKEVCSFEGVLRTYPSKDGFLLATTNRDTTNAIFDLTGTPLSLSTADGKKVESFKIHQEGDVYGGALLFGTKYLRFDEIVLEGGGEMHEVSGVLDVASKTVKILEAGTFLYDCNDGYVIARYQNENNTAEDDTYCLYADGYSSLVIDLSNHDALNGYRLNDAKFFSREKGYILLSLTKDYQSYYAIMDVNGKMIVNITEGYVPFLTDSNYLADDNLYPFASNSVNGKGVRDLSGNTLIACGEYQSMSQFVKGHAVVNENTVINSKKEVIYSIAE